MISGMAYGVEKIKVSKDLAPVYDSGDPETFGLAMVYTRY